MERAVDGDGFTLVTRGRRGRGGASRNCTSKARSKSKKSSFSYQSRAGSAVEKAPEDASTVRRRFLREFDQARVAIRRTDFFRRLVENIAAAFDSASASGGEEDGAEAASFDIVAYGVGNFCSSTNARYQLACASLLVEAARNGAFAASTGGFNEKGAEEREKEREKEGKEEREVTEEGNDNDMKTKRLDDVHSTSSAPASTAPNFFFFDPVLSKLETSLLLTEFGASIITQNEEGKRKVKRRTLFFMPHCDLWLYSNVLWANWAPAGLAATVIAGNSFSVSGGRRGEGDFLTPP